MPLIPQFGGIWGFIVRRILLSLLVLFIVSIIVFAATQALGDPARAILGRQATPESLKALRDQLNLDRSVFSQYWSWLTGLLHGDAGVSFAAQIPVSDLINERIVNSAFLVFCSGHHLDPARDRDRRLRRAPPRQASSTTQAR